MLAPGDRRLLLDALRPPEGCTLDRAVVTTYSLDLVTLLTAPLAFTMLHWEGEDGQVAADPLALLTAIRQYAEKITVFCQAGRIAVPRNQHRLFSYLESSVVQVAPNDRRGVFHPKVWVLRYAQPGGVVCYRLLCLSRNLTGDRSWDVALRLDGELKEQGTVPENEVLAGFLERLTGPDAKGITEGQSETVRGMAAELRRVAFEKPEGVDSYRFWTPGVQGAESWPFGEEGGRLVVVSPFLTKGFLDRVTEGRRAVALVSRAEEMAKLGKLGTGMFETRYALSATAEGEPPEEEAEEDAGVDTLAGLHAKLYLLDTGESATVWVGSANATTAAFRDNVEFLAELKGPSRKIGIKAFLAEGEKEAPGFLKLLSVYEPPEEGEGEGDTAAEALADEVRRGLVSADLVARVVEEGGGYGVVIAARGPLPKVTRDAQVQVWSIMVKKSSAVGVRFDQNEIARLPAGTLQSLTTFFAFEVRAAVEGQAFTCCFVLNLPLEGAPAGRRAALLQQMLANREQVLRLLLMLLGVDGSLDVEHMTTLLRQSEGGENGSTEPFEVPLLESLLKALDRDQEKLDQVASVVRELSVTEDGRALLPEGFQAVWEVVWQAREALRA